MTSNPLGRPTTIPGPTGVILQLWRTARGAALPSSADMVNPLDDLEKQRAARYLKKEQASSFIAGRYLLRLLAAELTGTDPRRLRTTFTCSVCGPGGSPSDHGRPGYSLDGAELHLALSLSRARGFVLLGALEPTTPRTDRTIPESSPPITRIGVDLEAVDDVQFDGFDAVALSAAEGHRMEGLTGTQLADGRARLWTRKEALVKAQGLGFGLVAPHEIDVDSDPRITDLTDLTDLSDRRGADLDGPTPHGLVAAVAVL